MSPNARDHLWSIWPYAEAQNSTKLRRKLANADWRDDSWSCRGKHKSEFRKERLSMLSWRPLSAFLLPLASKGTSQQRKFNTIQKFTSNSSLFDSLDGDCIFGHGIETENLYLTTLGWFQGPNVSNEEALHLLSRQGPVPSTHMMHREALDITIT